MPRYLRITKFCEFAASFCRIVPAPPVNRGLQQSI